MAFSIKDLGVLAYAHGFTFWYYRTEDQADAVQEVGYFADAADMLRIGDRITGSTSDRRAIDLVVARNDTRGVSVQRVAAAPGHYR
jgi:hypothetical protein